MTEKDKVEEHRGRNILFLVSILSFNKVKYFNIQRTTSNITYLYRFVLLFCIIPVQICAKCKGKTHLTVHYTSKDRWQQGLEHVGTQYGANL